MARNFVIVVDSCSDLSKEVREQNEIKYVKMGLVKNVGKENEEEIPASLDGDVFTHKELFDWLRGGMTMKTTQVSMEEYQNVFLLMLAKRTISVTLTLLYPFFLTSSIKASFIDCLVFVILKSSFFNFIHLLYIVLTNKRQMSHK